MNSAIVKSNIEKLEKVRIVNTDNPKIAAAQRLVAMALDLYTEA